MRRRISLTAFAFRRVPRRCKTDAPVPSGDTAAASARLVRSIGFDPDAMESLAHRFATGKWSPAAGPSSVRLLLAQTVRADPQLSSVLHELAVSSRLARGDELGATCLARALRRGARRVASLQPRLFAGALPLGAAAALFAALHALLLDFRREGRRRVRDGAAGVPAWRHAAVVSFAGAFAAAASAARPARRGGVCAAALAASAVAAADEMRWHSARLVAQTSTAAVVRQVDASEAAVVAEAARAIGAARKGNGEAAPLADALRAAELVAAAVAGNTRGRRSGDVALCLSAMALVFDALAAEEREPRPKVIGEIATRVQELWAVAASPRERRASDATMTHRTVHAALNRRFIRAAEPEAKRDAIAVQPDEIEEFLRCISRGVNALTRWQTARGTTLRALVKPQAIICRTVLDMEADMYFVACAATGREWTTPIYIGDSERRSRQRRGKGIVQGDNTADGAVKKDDTNEVVNGDDGRIPKEDSWALVLRAAAELRVTSSALVALYFCAFVALELAETDRSLDRPFVQRAFYRFLSAIATSYYPLLRRHYLDSGGKEILGECLRTFVALKQASDVLDGDGDERRSGERVAFRVCGVNLAQAMEIAFFLSVQDGTSIDAQVVPAYVKEVLFALDHNTAKQLWHLRAGKGVQRCFTGEDFEAGDDERMQRRHAQSTLTVVHAHVMHPSFLWMPLWQLQELIYVLSRNRELFEGPAVRVGSRGGLLRHFSRALGYVMLRLFVVSNIVRQYRSDSPGLAARPRRPAAESAAEGARRQRRLWAKAAAARLRDGLPGLPAAAEGMRHAEEAKQRLRGGQRVIGRLEATVHLAMRHRLLFDVRRRRRERAAKAEVTEVKTSGAADGEQKTTQANDEGEKKALARSVTVRVRRADAAAPLGFVLHGESAVVRRIAGDDGAAPFVQALHAAGVTDPSAVVGWRVQRVEDHEVETGRSVIALVKGKVEFTMTLFQP